MVDEFEKNLRRARIGTVYNGLMAIVAIGLLQSAFFAFFFMALYLNGIIAETVVLCDFMDE